ncbi:MAG: ATP-binding protein [Myxococcales bacterium]|mgnify:CR=1 FL=1|jgi:hypothetical protein|nr:ATP-binding protein [Myxococcales bacterium]MBL0193032.1 ATP-binding protein [Myxococcales bacterium]HQY60861.1 ATP-binding protein [Polyangiaceae bacterium]
MSPEASTPLSELDERTLATTTTRLRLTVGPLDHVTGDLAGLVGEHALQLLGMFYPRNVARKANVVVTELVTNVFENIYDPKSSFDLELDAGPTGLVIGVRNQVTPEQYAKVKARVDLIRDTPDLRAMVANTIRERRKERLKGGLGLMRLAQENKFDIGIAYQDGAMTVTATYTAVQS